MTTYHEILDPLITESSSELVQRLVKGYSEAFTEAEIEEMEQDILRRAPENVNLAKLITAFQERIASASPESVESLRKKVSFSFPTKSNPHHELDIRDSEDILSVAEAWLKIQSLPRTPSSDTAGRSFAKFVVAAIVDFEILHIDYLPALVSSIQCRQWGFFHPTIIGIALSLPHGRQRDAECRLFLVSGKLCTTLRRFLQHPDRDSFLHTTSDILEKGAKEAIAEQISNEIKDLSTNTGPVSLGSLLKAAAQMATVKLPPAIATHRRRTSVSHSLPPERLSRIGNVSFPPFSDFRFERQRSIVPDQEEAGESNESSSFDLPWMPKLREAVTKTAVDIAALQELATCTSDSGASTIGDYALYLMKKRMLPSSVYRYVFLVAERLIPRLADRAPASLDEDAWEDLIENILDDDAFFHRRAVNDGSSFNQAGYSRPLVKALRHFALFALRGNNISRSISDKLPTSGIVSVDANFYTVDEYLAAFDELASARPTPNTYQIEAARAALILGYRCGLRRAEAAFLRPIDFDVDDHLHVRPWLLRKLKTSNARRDLPLKNLMPQSEFEELMRFVQRARNRSGDTDGNGPLFCKEGDPLSPMDFDRLLLRINDAFRYVLKENSFRYHHLRHSFANICLLRLWPELHPIAKHILRAHDRTLEWIADSDLFRMALFHTRKLRGQDLSAIALLMGHGSAATTVEHYLHVFDWYQKKNAAVDDRTV